MKSLVESLFDKDLITRNVSMIGVLIDHLMNNTKTINFSDVIDSISKDINYKPSIKFNINNISGNKIYICILPDEILLVGYGVLQKKLSRPDIISIKYSPLGKIVISGSRATDDDYNLMSNILIKDGYKFDVYELSKQDIKEFNKNIINNDKKFLILISTSTISSPLMYL